MSVSGWARLGQAGALDNVSFDGITERRSNLLADQVRVSSSELNLVKTIDINPQNTPLVYTAS